MAEDKSTYTYKLEIYYQAIAIYAITMIAYGVVSAVARQSMEFVWKDQVVYLLALCTFAAIVGLVANVIARRRIEITNDMIVLRSRFHRREIPISDIVWIRIGREKRMRVRGAYRVAKLKLRNRRKLLRMRPSLFHPEDRLVEALRRINVQAHKAHNGAHHE